MRRRQHDFRPLDTSGHGTLVAIVLAFVLFSGLSLLLFVRTTAHASHRAPILQIASRQRTLAETYTKSVLLVQEGGQADPAKLASLLESSATALLDGGPAPAADGDDDEAQLPRASGTTVRRQIKQEQSLIHDLVATGTSLLANKRGPIHLLGHEHLPPQTSQTKRLIVLTGLTSNVSLNVARTIGTADDARLSALIRQQIMLGGLGLLVFALLSWALVASTRRQSAHFRSLVTSTTDLVLAFTGPSCRYASKSVLEMLGRPERDVLRSGFVGLVHPDDREALEAALETGSPPTLAFRLPSPLGDTRDLEANVTDLRSDRHVRSVVLNARDVTERNRAEAERDHVLAQERLANERLRELDKLKDEFVALVSHELRTPLTSITGYLEMMLEGTLGDDERGFGEIIGRNADRLLLLINDLLFIAQIEASELTVEQDTIELGILAAQAAAAAMPVARTANIDLHYAVVPNLHLTGDADRIGQLLDNLVSNAIKFTPAGGRVEIAIGTGDGKAWIEVRDTGIGISKADQEFLFNKFFRTKAATQAAIQGTGLGLAISKAIVHAHGGTIYVTSDQTAGSVFRVELPLKEKPTTPSASPHEDSALSATANHF
jgi:PAS domain S-box-containing protein